MYVFERLLVYREKANIWTPVKIWHKNKTFFSVSSAFSQIFWKNYTLSLYFMKSRQTHVENVNADYFEICKNAPQNCTNAFVWDSEQQTKIFYFFLKWQKLGIRSRDVFICQLMVADNLFSQQTKFWWMFFLNKRCQKPTQKTAICNGKKYH